MTREELSEHLGITLKNQEQFYCDADPGICLPDSDGTYGYVCGPRGSISPEEGRILSSHTTGKRVLEIGTGLGVSTYFLSLNAAFVDTVDPDPWVRSGVIKFRSNVFQKATLAECVGPYDFAFIDGMHDTESVVADIHGVLSKLAPGGKISFHDMTWGSVVDAVAQFEWESCEDHETLGKLSIRVPKVAP